MIFSHSLHRLFPFMLCRVKPAWLNLLTEASHSSAQTALQALQVLAQHACVALCCTASGNLCQCTATSTASLQGTWPVPGAFLGLPRTGYGKTVLAPLAARHSPQFSLLSSGARRLYRGPLHRRSTALRQPQFSTLVCHALAR